MTINRRLLGVILFCALLLGILKVHFDSQVTHYPQYTPTALSTREGYIQYIDKSTDVSFYYSSKYRVQLSTAGSIGFQYSNNNLENSRVVAWVLEVPKNAILPDYAIQKYSQWLSGTWSEPKSVNIYQREANNSAIFPFITPNNLEGYEIYLNTSINNLTINKTDELQSWGPLFVVKLSNRGSVTNKFLYAHPFLNYTPQDLEILKTMVNTVHSETDKK